MHGSLPSFLKKVTFCHWCRICCAGESEGQDTQGESGRSGSKRRSLRMLASVTRNSDSHASFATQTKSRRQSRILKKEEEAVSAADIDDLKHIEREYGDEKRGGSGDSNFEELDTVDTKERKPKSSPQDIENVIHASHSGRERK